MDEDISFRGLFVPFTTTKAIVFLILVGFIVYFNGLFNSFLGDDLGQIVNNPYINSFKNIPSFFAGSTFYNGGGLTGNYFRPIPLISFTIINVLFGQHAFLFHFFQISVHIANSILIFIFVKKFFKKIPAFLIASIFLLHPVNSESVFYISNTQEVLFLFFGLLSLITIQTNKSSKAIFISTVFVFLSMLSKETGAAFCVINILYAYIFNRKIYKKYSLFLLGAGAFYAVARINAVGVFQNPSNSPIAQLTFVERVINIPAIIFFYIKTFFIPLNLSSSYQWTFSKIDLQNFFVPAGFIVLLMVTILLAVKSLKKRKDLAIFSFFLLWFLIGLLPHLQLLPLDATVGERWIYLPIIGVLGLIGVILKNFSYKLHSKSLFIFLVLLIALLSLRTFMRSYDWRNTFSLANHDLKVSKEAYGLYNMLSYYFFQEGEYEKAAEYAQKSVLIHPFMTNYLNLGASEFAMGDYEKANKNFRISLKYGDYYQTYENLAFLSLSYGDPIKNIEFIRNVSLKKYPRSAKLWFYLAALEYNFGDKTLAAEDIEKAYSIDQSNQILQTYLAIKNNKPVRIGLSSK